jgi:hypothetical protein
MNDMPNVFDLVLGGPNSPLSNGWNIDLNLLAPDGFNILNGNNRNFFGNIFDSLDAKRNVSLCVLSLSVVCLSKRCNLATYPLPISGLAHCRSTYLMGPPLLISLMKIWHMVLGRSGRILWRYRHSSNIRLRIRSLRPFLAEQTMAPV